MLTRASLFALALGLAAPAFAQKAAPVSPYELGSDPVEALSADGRTYLNAARPAILAGLDAPVAPGAPAEQARAFLAGRMTELGLKRADTADLNILHVREGLSGTTVRFQQTVAGVPVWNAVTSVTLDPDSRVQFVANGYRDGLADVNTIPSVPESSARTTAHGHLGLTETPAIEFAHLVVWPGETTRLAWVFRLESDQLSGDWEIAVDAHTNELLRVADRRVFHSNGEEDDRPPMALPLAELSPMFRVDGTGFIFDPDPNTRAGVPRNTTGYLDGGDADTPQLTAARVQKTLRDIEFDGTNYKLSSPWAEVQDWDPDGPFFGLFEQPSPDFDFTRSASAFEAVTTFWHIDNYMRYVNVELGIDARPSLYPGGVRFDPHGLAGEDNSFYTRASQRVSFGEGCVDDAEDADVIIHELGHGLHDWLAGTISNSIADGLSEGFGDYVAASYTRSLGLLSPSDAAYNRVFKWDGWYSNCWQGRRTNVTTVYPNGGPRHGVGQNWATSLMRVWDVLGREATDRAVFEGMARGNSQTTQPQAAQAVLQAAADMGYSTADLQVFFDSFTQQNYNVSFPVSAEDVAAAERAGVLLSEASPNPFNGLTTFDVMVDRPQAVTVEVFDVLGRRVELLFEGEMTAGQRYPFALDAADLRSGVYVYRVTGETVSAARRVTLAR